MAEQTLADDKADIIGMSRALTADPDWPRKSAGELSGDIIPCIACNQCWVSSMTGEKIRCVVNPSVGSELTRRGRPPRPAGTCWWWAAVPPA